jgi:hypothetical protein
MPQLEQPDSASQLVPPSPLDLLDPQRLQQHHLRLLFFDFDFFASQPHPASQFATAACVSTTVGAALGCATYTYGCILYFAPIDDWIILATIIQHTTMNPSQDETGNDVPATSGSSGGKDKKKAAPAPAGGGAGGAGGGGGEEGLSKS